MTKRKSIEIIKNPETKDLVVYNGQKYEVIYQTNDKHLISSMDNKKEEILVSKEQVSFYFPLEVGKRYMFTKKRSNGCDSLSLVGVFTVTEIVGHSFRLNGWGETYLLSMFSDITSLEDIPSLI